MSRKGRSPDNSRAEGFFGRLKVEFFYGRGWDDVSMGEFMEMLDTYLVWYRDKRRKSDLGYMSPMQYRRELGPAAQEKPVQDFHRTPMPSSRFNSANPSGTNLAAAPRLRLDWNTPIHQREEDG